MDKRKRSALELGKTALICLLACSAVYLSIRTQLFDHAFFRGQQDESGTESEMGTATGGEMLRQMIRPVRMAVQSDSGRYGVQYDSEAVDALFERTANLLAEAMSSVSRPVETSRAAWEQALISTPSIYFDFLGRVPVGALQDWMSVGRSNAALSGTVRKLLLAPGEGDSVLLYYINEEDGMYYACETDILKQEQLRTAISGLTGNGARFAFETEEYAGIDPDVLILPSPPQLAAYTAADPLTGEEGDTIGEAVAAQLKFNTQGSNRYSGADGVVIRNGADTLRMSHSGTITYSGGEQADPRFPVALDGDGKMQEKDVVQAAYEIAAQIMLPYAGEAQLFLQKVSNSGDGRMELCFDYSLSGAEVGRLDGACAAHFVAEAGSIVSFTLNMRTYSAAGEPEAVLPELQAQAAAEALGAEQPELRICYYDNLNGTATPEWIAD